MTLFSKLTNSKGITTAAFGGTEVRFGASRIEKLKDRLPMLSAFGLVLLGGLFLMLGGEGLVRSASSLALRLRLTPTVIGLTVMALGTSLPELVVSVQAQLADKADMAFGNVVGSNLFNMGMVLGLTAMIVPLKIHGSTVRLEWPFMMLATVLVAVLARSGPEGQPRVDLWEGVLLLVSLIVFTGYMVRLARDETTKKEAESMSEAVSELAGDHEPLLRTLLILVVGCVALHFGSVWFVKGASELGRGFGISDRVIGLTVVAAGTGAPELAASLLAAWRGKTDMAVGNVIGSNIFNLLGILGAAALVKPLDTSMEILNRDMWWLLGISLLLGPLLLGQRIVRWNGVVLAVLYVAFTLSLYFGGLS